MLNIKSNVHTLLYYIIRYADVNMIHFFLLENENADYALRYHKKKVPHGAIRVPNPPLRNGNC